MKRCQSHRKNLKCNRKTFHQTDRQTSESLIYLVVASKYQSKKNLCVVVGIQITTDFFGVQFDNVSKFLNIL